MRIGSDAEVIEPPELRCRVAQTARALTRLHGGRREEAASVEKAANRSLQNRCRIGFPNYGLTHQSASRTPRRVAGLPVGLISDA
jgi:hypothetical protein